MLILNSLNRIGGYELDFVNEVEITSSWEDLTDTARIVIPKKIIYKRNGVEADNITRGDNAIFKVGDSVELFAGYSGGINTSGLSDRFKGYITGVNPKFPISMTLEDEMYQFKQIKVGAYAKKDLTLSQLLSDIIPSGYEFSSDDRNIGWIRIKDPNTTIAGVLNHLKEKQGVISYFRGKKLISGFAYTNEDEENNKTPTPDAIFDARKNIIDADGLEWQTKDDYKVRIKVISIYPDNTKKEVEVGKDGGDNFTVYVYNVPEKDLLDRANNELKKFNYSGFRGSFVTFLEPQVKHGDVVQIIDDRITDRKDVYLVKRVTTNYGVSGGRQTIELDRIVLEK